MRRTVVIAALAAAVASITAAPTATAVHPCSPAGLVQNADEQGWPAAVTRCAEALPAGDSVARCVSHEAGDDGPILVWDANACGGPCSPKPRSGVWLRC